MSTTADAAVVLEVDGGRPLHGRLRVPGDKSISHRGLLIAALADGTSEVSGRNDGQDVVRTAVVVTALGARVEGDRITGGRQHLAEPRGPLDLGNSGTGMRLLAGLVAGLDGLFVLYGDESLSSRPMDRIAAPLRAMGAFVDGRAGGSLLPLVIRGGGLHGAELAPPVASAQVKSAILLAACSADSETVVREALATRGHTEEVLALAGADLDVVDDGPSRVVRLRPRTLQPFRLDVPGDPSQAAFWAVAACCTPRSEVVVEHVYLGPGRSGFVDVLRRMGADIELVATGEGTADLVARSGPLVATDIGAAEIPGLIDEVPVLAVAAAFAEGTTTITGASELRVKETDRIRTTVGALRALGVVAEPLEDGLVVHGGGLRPGVVDGEGDHRIAMAAAVAGLAVEGTTRVTGIGGIATSYTSFLRDLRTLQGW